MELTIRQETESDHHAVFQLIKEAFSNMEMSDHQEHFLVARLRKSSAFIPELSLVAELEGKIVGHIILTRIKIKKGLNTHDSLALAPVSVLPDHQKKGIGGRLITAAHEKARTLGFTSVVLLGHKEYYPKFGYVTAGTFGIELPFDVPKEYCMAIELKQDGLSGVAGIVEYPKEFFE